MADSSFTIDPISEAAHYLAADLDTVAGLLHDLTNSRSRLIHEVGEYVLSHAGKRLRPILTLLAARAFGSGEQHPARLAAALEAIHLATLIHDDVIDKAAMRRGNPSVNARWNNDVAILMADYLFASAFDLAMAEARPELLRLICQVTRRMCEGEMYQIEQGERWLGAEDYLHIISCKTAGLFSACGALGGTYAGVDPASLARLSAFGQNFGLAFQITDDALDYMASDGHWGKPVGIDLANGKQTLPLILAHQDATPADRGRLESIMANGRDFGSVVELMKRYGSIERTLAMADGYARESARLLEQMPYHDERAFRLLAGLPSYVTARQY